MEGVSERLQRIGLTEYEAKAYLALLNTHLNTATKVSEKSDVPRTRIYSVLEALAQKGWIRIYSGVPLLFRAVAPEEVFARVKEEYGEFLDSLKTIVKEEERNMKDKFVIKRFDIGLENLKAEMKKAKTVEINNATADFIKEVTDTFKDKRARYHGMRQMRQMHDGHFRGRLALFPEMVTFSAEPNGFLQSPPTLLLPMKSPKGLNQMMYSRVSEAQKDSL